MQRVQPCHRCLQWIRTNTKQSMPFSKRVPVSSVKFVKIVKLLSQRTKDLLRLSQETSRWKARGYSVIWGTQWSTVTPVTSHDGKFSAASHGKLSNPFTETVHWAEQLWAENIGDWVQILQSLHLIAPRSETHAGIAGVERHFTGGR